ncbi:tyrosine-type recombinase/integrase [Geobacter hydrogenophilus]|uniref:tyrosine-type recombinase/integrase n=1 Tax=Geobacter hydrogenophilus TaxID=40983 RepID=UPI001BDA18AE
MPSFTDFFIKNLKPKNKAYRISEGRGGFCIVVHPTGSKSFLYRYKIHGRDAAIALGKYPTEVSLLEARQKYNRAYEAYKSGQDPKLSLSPPPPEGSTPETPLPAGVTIKELMELFITNWSEHNHSKRWSRANRLCLEKDLIPEWGEKKPSDLKPKDAYNLIDKVARRAPATARNLIKAAASMYDYAIRQEYVEFNPFVLKFSKHSPKIIPKSRERILDEDEIRFLWKAIDDGPGTSEVKRSIKLILITAQRPGEVAGMRFSEIDGNWWTIPPERIKTEKKVGLGHIPRPHMVYLTPLAKELIGEPGWAGDIVFPAIKGHNKRKGTKSAYKSIDSNALNKRISRKDEKGPKGKKTVVKEPYYGLSQWGPHDLRRTADTMMNSIGIDHRHVEMVLNHSLGKVEGIYNKYQYNDEKKAALLKWESKIKDLISNSHERLISI